MTLRQRWRTAETTTRIVLVLVAFFTPLKADWFRDPTSDNLWGLIFILIGLLICVYSLVLLLVQRHHMKRGAEPD